jgi:hypothetical protein
MSKFGPSTVVSTESRFGPSSVVEPVEQQETSITQDIDTALRKIPGAASLAELAAGANRTVVDFIDFLGPDQVNSILEIGGSEKRVPTLRSQLPFIESGPLEPGLQKQVLGAVGEAVPAAAGVGGLLKAGASALPAATAGESALTGVVREVGRAAPAQDVILGGISGGGGEFGKEVAGQGGQIAGSILAPLSAVAVPKLIGGAISQGAKGIQNLTRDLADLSEEGAGTLLAEQMVREGLSPADVQRQLLELGPESIPADLGNNFARLLRTASNKIPTIERDAARTLDARQKEQSNRLIEAFDDATNTSKLNASDEIARLNTSLKPEIDNLFAQTRAKDLQLSENLSGLLGGKSSLGRARQKAEIRLEDKRAAGDEIGNIDIIDATKQELDDQINVALRQGENNKVRDLVRLKKVMIEEADTAIPEYKQARDLFAGKINLENAAASGEQYFKLKPREIDDLVSTMGDSEARMFKLGAKQAILDKIDTLAINADSVKRLFGKQGDVQKLKGIFQDESSFNRFSETLEREATFALTRRAAQANSTTAKQVADIGNAQQALELAGTSIVDPITGGAKFGQILFGLSAKKGDEVFTRSLEQAGDLLLAGGADQAKILGILKRAEREEIRNALEGVMTQVSSDVLAPTGKAAVSATLEDTL